MSKPTKQITGILKMLDHNAEMQTKAVARWRRRAEKAEQDRNHWHDKAQEYKQQSAEYRESRDKWCEAAVREQLASQDTLPRVITADELKPGQVIAFTDYSEPKKWHTEVYSVRDDFDAVYDGTIVLLADAPEPKPVPTLPEQEGALIQVTELNEVADKVWGEFLPFFAYLEAHEVFGTTWISTTGEIAVAPHQIVGWLPVRAVES